MVEIATQDLSQASPLSPDANNQVYCGLDSMLTLEVWRALRAKPPPKIYDFTRALQAPYMEIMQRGFLVDDPARRRAASALRARLRRLEGDPESGDPGLLNTLSRAVWGKGLNPRSPAQLKQFFYEAMKLPEVWQSVKGVRSLSTNREALEKLELYMHARPFCQIILAIRDIGKQLDTLECDVDSDGRYRAGYNIAGTETGRPSSSQNSFGTGGNAQNIAPGLRFIFQSDPGYKMCVIDLEQVEARDVGWFCGCLFSDWDFLDACESGDLHSNNAKRIWPELAWTGDRKQDRAIADRNFYREFSYRDMAKRGSHLSNYMGTAWTAARSLKVPLPIMEEFQARYCRGDRCAFPAIAKWWAWTAEQLQTSHKLITPFGRERHFFGRPGDDTTLREAIAFLPQSTTADRMNLGLWRVWKHLGHVVQLQAQTYDSITFQYREASPEAEAEIIQEALRLIQVELVHPQGRRYVVPGEAKVGWNWAGASPGNPEGLIKWYPGFTEKRIRRTGLKRIIGSGH